jgi:hypothetical protein
VRTENFRDAVASAELVAAWKGNPAPNLPGAVKDWVTTQPAPVPADIVSLSLESLAIVRDDSELRDVWKDAGRREEWQASIDDLARRLRA